MSAGGPARNCTRSRREDRPRHQCLGLCGGRQRRGDAAARARSDQPLAARRGRAAGAGSRGAVQRADAQGGAPARGDPGRHPVVVRCVFGARHLGRRDARRDGFGGGPPVVHLGRGDLRLRRRERLPAAAVAGFAGGIYLARRNRRRSLFADPPSPARRVIAMTPPSLRVASDVGGTFTDNLAYDDEAKRVTVAKVPTTPENRALGTVRGLLRALALQGKAGGDVTYVGHGMTTATNAILQRTGGRTAFVTNEGFRDLLLIGRQNRPSLYDIRQTRPLPLAAREDCHTVRGRLDRDGHEVTPLDDEGLRRIAEDLREGGVE